MPHAFRVTGTSPVRFLGLVVPGGLFGLYDEVGRPARERRLPGSDGQPLDEEIRRWIEIGPQYGLRVIGPPIPLALSIIGALAAQGQPRDQRPTKIPAASGEISGGREIGAELVEQSPAALFAALDAVQAVEVDTLLGVG